MGIIAARQVSAFDVNESSVSWSAKISDVLFLRRMVDKVWNFCSRFAIPRLVSVPCIVIHAITV